MTTKIPAVKGTGQESQNTTGTTDDVEDVHQTLPQPDLSNIANSDLSPGTNLSVVDCKEQDDANADTQPLVADSDPPTARRYPRQGFFQDFAQGGVKMTYYNIVGGGAKT